jgi:hypothetical protein
MVSCLPPISGLLRNGPSYRTMDLTISHRHLFCPTSSRPGSPPPHPTTAIAPVVSQAAALQVSSSAPLPAPCCLSGSSGSAHCLELLEVENPIMDTAGEEGRRSGRHIVDAGVVRLMWNMSRSRAVRGDTGRIFGGRPRYI